MGRFGTAWRHSAMDPEHRADLRKALALGRQQLRSGHVVAGEQALLRAHGLARNAPLSHALCHVDLARLRLVQRDWAEVRGEAQRAALAPLASTLRRLAGRRPVDPVDDGLLALVRAVFQRNGPSVAQAHRVQVPHPVQR